jgi:AbrB family looped-hinge helix DNA binding protein
MLISIRIRSRGQLTLPRKVRELAHLEEGDSVEVEVVRDGILLRPKKEIDSTQAWFWTPRWQALEAQATADITAGRVEKFETDEDFLASLAD